MSFATARPVFEIGRCVKLEASLAPAALVARAANPSVYPRKWCCWASFWSLFALGGSSFMALCKAGLFICSRCLSLFRRNNIFEIARFSILP
jgi:hypothetical protein